MNDSEFTTWNDRGFEVIAVICESSSVYPFCGTCKDALIADAQYGAAIEVVISLFDFEFYLHTEGLNPSAVVFVWGQLV